MKEKTKFALYLPEDLRKELESRYEEDGSRSKTKFVEKALRFYLDYLSAENAGSYLPTTIQSCINGRLGIFEDRIAKLLFKMAVEHDIAISLWADNFEISEEYLRKKRGESVKNIKRTNGQISFEEIVRESGEEE